MTIEDCRQPCVFN